MGLNINDKKLIAAVILGTLAFCAFFLAQGTTSLVAASMFPLTNEISSEAGSPSRTVTAAPGSRAPDVKAILARNIFDSTVGPLWPPPDDSIDLSPDPIEDTDDYVLDPNNPPPRCEGSSVKLVASVYSETTPNWSFASLSTGSAPPLLYREGGEVEGNTVLAIYPKAVFLRPSGSKPCSLKMFDISDSNSPGAKRATSSVSTPPPPHPVRRTAQGGLSNEDMDQGISKINDTKYTISRGLIDKVLENQAALMRSARIVPHERNGEVLGVKLYGIRRNSLLGKLGLQNGDLLRTINGYNMSSPDSALEAYSRLRNSSNLTVSIQRRRKDMNLDYTIQ